MAARYFALQGVTLISCAVMSRLAKALASVLLVGFVLVVV
jgi:hypothetical protein